MAYTPGTLHIAAKDYGGTPATTGRAVITCEQSTVIKDPTDQSVGFVGPLKVELVNGVIDQALPPSTGMDPSPVTYRVGLQLDGFDDLEPVTGLEITSSQITNLFEWVSVVPEAGQPNFEQAMQEQVDLATGAALDAEASAELAAASAAEVVGDLGDAVDLGDRTGALDLTGYVLGAQGFRLRATGNLTLAAAALPQVPAGKVGSCSVRVLQDATGGRTLTLGAGILKPYGLQPSLSTAAGAVDEVHLLWDGITWQCYVGGLALA